MSKDGERLLRELFQKINLVKYYEHILDCELPLMIELAETDITEGDLDSYISKSYEEKLKEPGVMARVLGNKVLVIDN